MPLGAGAAGWLGGSFFFLEGDLESYEAAVDNGTKPVSMALRADDHDLLFRDISYQIELGYCDIAALGREHGVDVAGKVGPVIEQWERTGLIRQDKGCLYLRRPGEFWAVNLAQIMIDMLQS